jgi:hypothetical protein
VRRGGKWERQKTPAPGPAPSHACFTRKIAEPSRAYARIGAFSSRTAFLLYNDDAPDNGGDGGIGAPRSLLPTTTASLGHKSDVSSRRRAGLPSLIPFGLSVPHAAGVSIFTAGVLGHMALEGLSLVDAVYATTGVMSTVGIMVTPTSPESRLFTCLLNLASLGLTALLLAEVGEARKGWARQSLRAGDEVAQLLVAAVPPLVGAAVAFSVLEGWSLFTSFYFAIVAGTGLGTDGVLEPATPLARLVFCAYVFAEMGVMCNLLHVLTVRAKALLQAAADEAGRVEGGGGA